MSRGSHKDHTSQHGSPSRTGQVKWSEGVRRGIRMGTNRPREVTGELRKVGTQLDGLENYSEEILLFMKSFNVLRRDHVKMNNFEGTLYRVNRVSD